MKIQRFSGIQKEFNFFEIDNLDRFVQRFYQSDLGKIYLAIPWEKLVKAFEIKPKRYGRPMDIPPQGRIALMFLKNYSGFSDRKLIEQLNGNPEWQMFCGIYLGHHRIENYKIDSQIRSELSAKLKIGKLQKILLEAWRPYIDQQDTISIDATCYESEVRNPTDVKLLWECVEWCHACMVRVCQYSGQQQLRTKYLKWKCRYVNYSKMRKKRLKRGNDLRRSSLLLIDKYIGFLMPHLNILQNKEIKKLALIKQIYTQQYDWFHKQIKPTNRIISLHKDYLHPIVRGKEIKSVEFGAKVNKIQIDAINFIEHLSFTAFNEGVRFKNSVHLAQWLTNTKVKVAAADTIYANNENRKFATLEQIKTDFKSKGPQSKDYKEQELVKGKIRKERVSRMEGSFGKEKEHYHLRKIKARTEANEILWIFFGIHVANALEIGRRLYARKLQAA